MPKPHANQKTAVCTILSKNYLHFGRTLMDSVEAFHPEYERYVLLVDELDLRFDPTSEKFRLVQLPDLSLPREQCFLYRYGVLELNTAVKPWMLRWLFEQRGHERVIYFDPDIALYGRLTEVEKLLDADALMVLTPHLTAPLQDRRRPSEHDILSAGAYNLGFIALAEHSDLGSFLAWWQRHLEFDCRVDVANNLFVDQRWMDLVPALFPDVHILRDEGCNVAYWNLATRTVARVDGGYCVNGHPLVFFHFSGLDPLAPSALSKHQGRFRLRDVGDAADLIRDYCKRALANGLRECRSWPYAFDRLDDDTRINRHMRTYYRGNAAAQSEAGDDPYCSNHEYLNRPWGSIDEPLITELMREVWKNRDDLRREFPNLDGSDRLTYVTCFVESVADEEGVDARFVEPARASLELPARSNDRTRFRMVSQFRTSMARRALRLGLTCVGKLLPFTPTRATVAALYTRTRWLIEFLPGPMQQQLREEVEHWLLARRSRQRGGWVRGIVQRLATLLRIRSAREATQDVDARPLHPRDNESVTETPNGNDTPIAPILRLKSGEIGDGKPRHGMNIIGYLQSEHGIGESARLCAFAAESAHMPIALIDHQQGNLCRTSDSRWNHRLGADHPFSVNVFHINADQIAAVHASLPRHHVDGRYNIGFWHWELPQFPEKWCEAFEYVDEVWAPSWFVHESVSMCSPVPVVRMGHGIHVPEGSEPRRDRFGLPSSRFLFLVMYDLRSFAERKNPEAALEAYHKAFGSNASRCDVGLVVKVNNPDADPEHLASLRQRLAEFPHAVLMDEVLTRQEVYDLEAVCDCFVSLHRSEGFGLGLAECMYLGKPVIATNWSGNCDFMTAHNSCPVDYRLVPIAADVGPYERGQIWADPDVEHAAWYMRKLTDDEGYRGRVATLGMQTIRTEYAPTRIGTLYGRRLKAIARRHDGYSTTRRAA